MAIAPTEQPSGFWSYVHRDNAAEGGRILRLAEKLEEEFEMLTGETLELFIDRKSLAWGEKWRSTLNDAITESTFFIAIVTPRYMKSDECRKEFLAFVQNARARNVVELMLPILYVPVDGLDEDSRDEVRKSVAEIQWEPFHELRLADENGVEYRTKVHELALRLVEVTNIVAERPESLPIGRPDHSGGPDRVNLNERLSGTDREDFPDDEEDGILDLNASLEELFPEWLPTLERYQQLMNKFTDVTNDFAPQMTSAAKKTQAAKLVVARQYANAISPIADDFLEIGSKYADQAMSAHKNILGIFQHLAGLTPEQRAAADADEFLGSVRQLAEAGEGAVESIRGFQKSTREVARMSKDVRRPLAKINQAVQSFIDGHELFEDWIHRIQELEAAGEFDNHEKEQS